MNTKTLLLSATLHAPVIFGLGFFGASQTALETEAPMTVEIFPAVKTSFQEHAELSPALLPKPRAIVKRLPPKAQIEPAKHQISAPTPIIKHIPLRAAKQGEKAFTPEPPYPQEALLHEIEGSFEVDLEVDEKGHIARVAACSHASGIDILVKSAEQTLKTWRLRSFGHSYRVRVPLRFRIES